MPRVAASRTDRELSKADLPCKVTWEGPLPSPGSAPQAERVIFRGYVPAAVALTLDLLVMKLQRKVSEPSRLIGHSATVGDQTAMLADITGTAVLPHIQEFLHSGLLLSAKVLLMAPRRDVAHWTALVDSLAKADAAACISSISWRKSNGGRPWVRPQMLAQDLRNRTTLARNRAAGRPGVDDDTANTVLVHMSGPTLGGDRDQTLQAITTKLEEILGHTLHQAQQGSSAGEQLAPHLHAGHQQLVGAGAG